VKSYVCRIWYNLYDQIESGSAAQILTIRYLVELHHPIIMAVDTVSPTSVLPNDAPTKEVQGKKEEKPVEASTEPQDDPTETASNAEAAPAKETPTEASKTTESAKEEDVNEEAKCKKRSSPTKQPEESTHQDKKAATTCEESQEVVVEEFKEDEEPKGGVPEADPVTATQPEQQ